MDQVESLLPGHIRHLIEQLARLLVHLSRVPPGIGRDQLLLDGVRVKHDRLGRVVHLVIEPRLSRSAPPAQNGEGRRLPVRRRGGLLAGVRHELVDDRLMQLGPLRRVLPVLLIALVCRLDRIQALVDVRHLRPNVGREAVENTIGGDVRIGEPRRVGMSVELVGRDPPVARAIPCPAPRRPAAALAPSDPTLSGLAVRRLRRRPQQVLVPDLVLALPVVDRHAIGAARHDLALALHVTVAEPDHVAMFHRRGTLARATRARFLRFVRAAPHPPLRLVSGPVRHALQRQPRAVRQRAALHEQHESVGDHHGSRCFREAAEPGQYGIVLHAGTPFRPGQGLDRGGAGSSGFDSPVGTSPAR